jgi:hypothetical protein
MDTRTPVQTPIPTRKSRAVALREYQESPAYYLHEGPHYEPADPDDPFALEPWDRQPGETPEAYHAFKCYRDMDALTRSKRQVRDVLAVKQGNLRIWSEQWAWDERVFAWDRNVQDQVDRLAIREREEMYKLHIQTARKMLEAVETRLGTLEPAELDPQDIARWIDLAVKTERLTRGEATEHALQRVVAQQQVTHDFDDGQLRDAFAGAIRDLARESFGDGSGATEGAAEWVDTTLSTPEAATILALPEP